MEAIVIYHSKTGITKNYGSEIYSFLKENNIPCQLVPVDEVKPEDIINSDAVFIGCWTSGLFLFGQHPDPVWKKHAARFPDLKDKKIGLFTTYKLATGSMFRKMENVLKEKNSGNIAFMLKSKTGKLSVEDRINLKNFFN